MDIERKSLAKSTGGTLRWTAPEILVGHRISFASDGKIDLSHQYWDLTNGVEQCMPSL